MQPRHPVAISLCLQYQYKVANGLNLVQRVGGQEILEVEHIMFGPQSYRGKQLLSADVCPILADTDAYPQVPRNMLEELLGNGCSQGGHGGRRNTCRKRLPPYSADGSAWPQKGVLNKRLPWWRKSPALGARRDSF